MVTAKANAAGKFVVITSDILAHMQNESVPTPAETTDVVNAVLDGADALMLTNATAFGAQPGEAVSVLSALIRCAEDGKRHWK